ARAEGPLHGRQPARLGCRGGDLAAAVLRAARPRIPGRVGRAGGDLRGLAAAGRGAGPSGAAGTPSGHERRRARRFDDLPVDGVDRRGAGLLLALVARGFVRGRAKPGAAGTAYAVASVDGGGAPGPRLADGL